MFMLNFCLPPKISDCIKKPPCAMASADMPEATQESEDKCQQQVIVGGLFWDTWHWPKIIIF